MNEKRKPHYSLAKIKAAFADSKTLNRTYSSRLGADELGFDDDAVVETIQALKSSDFDKSMTSHADATVWQDVYKARRAGVLLYVKFTVDPCGNLLLISFKEA